ncbi:hypothetical protein E0Z10_g8888 [Xylaria hypoxylon]|uniref:Uncharacterized protein n=1 Tax=Xylaria hypoxylon TaxID=37992 RepID=A0A4Z0YTV2_9PEZI|nr:hypothetical protein E0Z10_g8888 [Xylaria hypoxylon]
MKSIAIITGLLAVTALSAPVSIRQPTPASDLDLFNYTNNINNAVTVEDADGTKIVLSSPYTDDIEAADPAKVLGE